MDLGAANDGDFFEALERSRNNLDQLFGVRVPGRAGGDGPASQDADNTSLKYRPPNPPKPPTSGQQQQEGSWSTVLAKVVSAYKNRELVGKVGVALLRNSALGQQASKLIVYKTKTNVLATLTFDPAAERAQMYRQSHYMQFYDDGQAFWSLLFDRQDDDDEFGKQLCGLGVKVQAEDVVQQERQVVKEQQQRRLSTEFGAVSPFVERSEDNNDKSSINEMPRNIKADTHSKSALITRMAKMGQQLPMLAQHTALENSDSSDTDMLSTPLPASCKPIIVPRSNKLQAATQLVPVHQSFTVASGVSGVEPLETQLMQMLLTENRTQNSEMRMNMTKLETKIEKVLDRFELLNRGPAGGGKEDNAKKDDEILELEEKLIELKKENRKLKQTLDCREEQPPPRSEHKSAEFLLKLYRDDLELLALPPSARDTETLVGNLIEKAITLQNKLKAGEAMRAESVSELKEYQLKYSAEKERLREANEKIAQLEERLKGRNDNEIKLRDELAERAQQLSVLNHHAEGRVLGIMNNVYANLKDKIEQVDGSLPKEVILQLIGKTIREETLNAIKEIKQ